MQQGDQVVAELKGRAGLKSKFIVTVVRVHVSKGADDIYCKRIVDAASRLKGVVVDESSDLSSFWGILIKSDRGDKVDTSKEENRRYQGYKYLVVMELADRSLGTALMHEHIVSNERPLVRKIGGYLAYAFDDLHIQGRIHADFKPLNIVRVPKDGHNFTYFFSWQLIDLYVSCIVGSTKLG